MAKTVIDIEHLANLARMNLTPEEATHFTEQIESILAYVDQLKAIDVEGVEETAQVTGLVNVLRADEPSPELDPVSQLARREALLAAAVQTRDGFVAVPAVLAAE